MIQLTERRSPANSMKIAAVFVLAVLAFALTACSGGAKTETTFTMTRQGVEMTLVYYATGDEVTRQTTRNVMPYEALDVADADEARALIEPLTTGFQDVKGLTYSVEYTDTEAIETLDVDYSVADIAEIAELTGSSFSGDTSGNAKLSLEQSRQMLLNQGFTEVD